MSHQKIHRIRKHRKNRRHQPIQMRRKISNSQLELDDLDEDALVRVLKEPRNSLVKQYKELLSMDSVELEFTDEALHAIARKTIERKTGARGLRSVMEGILLPVMYDVPNDPTIIRVTIDKDTVEGGEAHLEYGAVRKRYKNQTALS